MEWQYDPRHAIPCLKAGTYNAKLATVSLLPSQEGPELLALDFLVQFVESSGDKTKFVRSWIANPTNLHMLKQLAIALGCESSFEEGRFDASQFSGRDVRIILRVVTTPMFGDQNAVVGFEPMPVPDEDADIQF